MGQFRKQHNNFAGERDKEREEAHPPDWCAYCGASAPFTANSGSNTLLFPARGRPSVPLNGWSKSKVALDEISGITGWTLHDLRRTFATRLAGLGVPIHVIEKL